MRLSRVLFPALLFLTVTAHAQTGQVVTPPVRPPSLEQVKILALHGLKNVDVGISADSIDVDTGKLRKAIEHQLQVRGVTIAEPGSPSMGILDVSFSHSKDVVLIRVRLLRLVSMDCQGEPFYTPMWESQEFSSLQSADDDLAKMVQHFIEDFKWINRK